MSRVRRYKDFISEEIFGIFDKVKKTPVKKTHVESCINNIILFLNDNQIKDWNDFEHMTSFDKDVINKLIDNEVDNIKDVKDIRFGVRLHLSDRQQLKDMLIEYEEKEEYEKCSKILKKIKEI